MEGGIDQEQIDEIKARYGIGAHAAGPGRFPIVLIQPSHYDDEGYVIQWFRSAMTSNSLAVMHGLVEDCIQRKVLGEQVRVEIRAMDENNTRIRVAQLARELKDGKGLVMLVGVESHRFPRAMDLALQLRVAGVNVCMSGTHVSGSIAMLGGVTPELQEAMNLGISLYAGEAEERRLDQVLRDAWLGQLRPLYDYANDPPSLEGAPLPVLPAKTIRGTIGGWTSFDAGRGSPFECSFSTIANVEGCESRRRTVDEVERIVRENLKQGVGRFFIGDGSFSQNPDWEAIFDRLIAMREQEKLGIEFMVQVDATCHRVPGFIEKARRAGVRRVVVGIESISPQSLMAAKIPQNRIEEYRPMLLEWKRAGVIVIAEYIVGFPGETPESVLRDIRMIKKELAIDLLEPHCLTALPGSEDHQSLYRGGAFLEPDMNRYDLEHVTRQHLTMTAEEWAKLYYETWMEFYTPEHMHTVLRRAAATGVPLREMMALLVWFYSSIVYEGIDPLHGGYLRQKYRQDRRPGLPKEGLLRFHTRYALNLLSKQIKIAQLYLRYRGFTKGLELDRSAKDYTDMALTPDSELDPSALEMLMAHAAVPQ